MDFDTYCYYVIGVCFMAVAALIAWAICEEVTKNQMERKWEEDTPFEITTKQLCEIMESTRRTSDYHLLTDNQGKPLNYVYPRALLPKEILYGRARITALEAEIIKLKESKWQIGKIN